MANRIRSLEITLISAKDLQDISLISKMDVYAVITITGDPNTPHPKVNTGVDRACGTNATWNFAARFAVDESLVRSNRLTLSVSLVCNRNNLGDREIGEVKVPVNDLLSSANGDSTAAKFVSYQVTKPNGTAKGELNFSYKFGESIIAGEISVPEEPSFSNLYPAPISGYNGNYDEQEQPAQPQPGYSYQNPYPIWAPGPDFAYPYPPRGAEYGYGYPATQAWGNGSVLGAGLEGGAFVGDVAYDVAAYGCNYGGCDVAGCGCQGVGRFDFQ